MGLYDMDQHGISANTGNFSKFLHSIQSKVSPRWLKCLTMMGCSSFSTSCSQAILNDSRLKGMDCTKADSWEEVLMTLIEESAVIHQGDLKLQPIFFSLSQIVQTRFLYLVHKNASKICDHHLNLFVSKLENSDVTKGHWTEFYLSTLQRSLCAGPKDKDLASFQTAGDYTFSAASQILLANFTKGRAISADTSPIYQATITKSILERQSSEMGVREQVVDVIIEGDSEESMEMSSQRSKTGIWSKKTLLPRQIGQSDSVIKNANSKIVQDNTVAASDSYRFRDVHIIGEGSKQKVTVSPKCNVDNDERESVLSISEEENSEPPSKLSKLSAQGEQDCTRSCLAGRDEACSDEHCAPLSDSVKANLVQLKEACFGHNKPATLVPGRLSFLQDLSLSELQSVTDFLKLGECLEESLIPFCEAVPWTQLDHRCAFVLLHGCVFNRVKTSDSPISQTLMTFMSAILRDHPQAVIDLLVKTVNMESNEIQCQMVATMCKEAISQEWLNYLIKQLKEELVVEVDSNILGVLQAIINRLPDLDPDCLTLLLALLEKGGQFAANSPTLGKCLMACLTKYNKQIMPDHLATLSSLVDTHSSNFKAALRAAFKRINN